MIISTTDNNEFLADGVTPNPNYGVVTESEIPDAPLSPATLTKLEFVTLCQTAGGMTDDMLVAAEGNSALAALWIKLGMATSVERDNSLTGAGLDALAQLSYLPNGKDAVLAAWPQA